MFVNNVSLGLYAEAVQHEGYRDAKIRTVLDTVPDVLGPTGDKLDLRWQDRAGTNTAGGLRARVQQRLPARPRARLGHAPRIDDGLLGITVIGSITWQDEEGRALQRPWRAWSSPTFEIGSGKPIAAGIDGEALVLDAPLEFRIRPRSCGCASPASTRAPRPRRWPPRESARRGRAGANRHRPGPEP